MENFVGSSSKFLRKEENTGFVASKKIQIVENHSREQMDSSNCQTENENCINSTWPDMAEEHMNATKGVISRTDLPLALITFFAVHQGCRRGSKYPNLFPFAFSLSLLAAEFFITTPFREHCSRTNSIKRDVFVLMAGRQSEVMGKLDATRKSRQ
ncbi:hypothetical protein ANCCAN_05044 [Ancylostoma caninum]|uniref:Uncharacterized protein n=1 Tax=Ancylostoma caninum TaxID=29170 RepID=A0A368H0Z6_ANCCA|nr:hypothetical protein ANCCAN_05044 [Ancylostoma caninum]